ncbi:MAG: hypothetical protein CMN30_01000 [Sandaracinus sp.]|nr:hypothetical protein [Sandaracinus sp.]
MNKTKIALSSLAALFCFSLYAGHASAWDASVYAVTIESIVVHQDGSFYIEADKDLCDPGVNNKIGYVYVGTNIDGHSWTAEGARMMLSTAQAAFLSGRTVTVLADNSGSNWGCQMGGIRLE